MGTRKYWVVYHDSKGIERSLLVEGFTPEGAKTLARLALAIVGDYRPHMKMRTVCV